jgi:hypothetical protein
MQPLDQVPALLQSLVAIRGAMQQSGVWNPAAHHDRAKGRA